MSDGSSHSDLELLRRYADARDADAFAELTRRYAPLVYGVALRVTGRSHDAEDVAQACFLELARRAGEVRTSVAGWLHALAASRACNAVRDRATRDRHERRAAVDAPPGAGPASGTPTPARSALPGRTDRDDQGGWADMQPLIDAEIAALPEDVRLPIVLHYLHGQSQQQVAEILGISQPTVHRRLSAGIEQLRRRLKRAGIVATTVGLASLLPRAAVEAGVVPATLRAALGKMAIAGVGAPTAVASSTVGGLGAWAAHAVATVKLVSPGALWSAATTLKAKFAVLFAMVAVLWCAATVFRTVFPARPAAATWTPAEMAERLSARPGRNVAAVALASDGLYTLPDVPPLVWGATHSGQTMVVGAAAVALRVAGAVESDYGTLLGDSGLAFRVRWMPIRTATVRDPLRAPRLFAARDLPLISESTGWNLGLFTEFVPGRRDLRPFAGAIAASIRAGKPVVAEDTMEHGGGLIFAASADGRRVRLHEYGGPPEGRVALLDDLGGGLLFLTEPTASPRTRRDAVLAALCAAAADWYRPREFAGFNVGSGAEASCDPDNLMTLLYGKSAWEAWVAQTRASAAWSPDLQQVFWRASWWNYDIYCDARHHAAAYLRRHAGLFHGEARRALLAAASEYERLRGEGLTDGVYHTPADPYRTAGTFEAWRRADREADARRLTRAAAIDAAAIRHIERAIEQIGLGGG